MATINLMDSYLKNYVIAAEIHWQNILVVTINHIGYHNIAWDLSQDCEKINTEIKIKKAAGNTYLFRDNYGFIL